MLAYVQHGDPQSAGPLAIGGTLTGHRFGLTTPTLRITTGRVLHRGDHSGRSCQVGHILGLKVREGEIFFGLCTGSTSL